MATAIGSLRGTGEVTVEVHVKCGVNTASNVCKLTVEEKAVYSELHGAIAKMSSGDASDPEIVKETAS